MYVVFIIYVYIFSIQKEFEYVSVAELFDQGDVPRGNSKFTLILPFAILYSLLVTIETDET